MNIFRKIRDGRPLFSMNFGVALIPVAVVTLLLLYIATGLGFSEPSSDIDPRLPLLIGAIVATLIAKATGVKWSDVEMGIAKSISGIATTLVMLLTIGILIATLMISGIVPSIIFYGIGVVQPQFILPLTFILTAIVSLALGSSWTTAAVIGLPLVMIGKEIGVSPEWVVGAAISGSYLGDKMSPLSDTTLLAAGVSKVSLFDHIKAMAKPTGIAAGIALIGFIVLGIVAPQTGGSTGQNIKIFQDQLLEVFPVISPFLIIPILLIIPIFTFKLPTIPSLLGMAIVGVLIALTVQGLSVAEIFDAISTGHFIPADSAPSEIAGIVVNVKGIDGMMWTISLVLCAMIFGGVLHETGIINALIRPLGRLLKKPRTLVITTGFTALAFNALTADQYTALALPPEFLADKYDELGINKTVLSQTLEGVGTVASPLIMWTSCSAYMMSVFGNYINGWGFVAFCFFNIASIAVALIGPAFGFFIKTKKENLID